MRLRPALLPFLLLAACHPPNPARDEALRRAADARARGDLPGEALALRDACTAAPRDATTCTRAQNAMAAAITGARSGAEIACQLADASASSLDGCLAAIAAIRRLD